MRILYLIGNGFDINVGLKTSFSSFLNYYLNQPVPSDIDIVGQNLIKQLKEDIKSNISLWSDMELQFGKFTSKLGNSESSSQTVLDELDFVNDDIIENLSRYIAVEDARAMFSDESKQKFFGVLSNPEEYFRDFETAKVKSLKRNIGQSISHEIDFVTFNYTRTIEKLLSDTKIQVAGYRVNQPVHVHGYYNERMIFGVNDESQIDNQELRNNRESKEVLIKSQNNHSYADEHTNRTQKLINSAHLICIYGMSLGETDKIWWQSICTQLQRRNDLMVLLFWHTDKLGDYSNNGPKLNREKRKIVEKLLNFGGLDPNTTNVSERVYVSINAPIFDFGIMEHNVSEKDAHIFNKEY